MNVLYEKINEARQVIIDALTEYVRQNGGSVVLDSDDEFPNHIDGMPIVSWHFLKIYIDDKGSCIVRYEEDDINGEYETYEEEIELFTFDEMVAVIDRIRK